MPIASEIPGRDTSRLAKALARAAEGWAVLPLFGVINGRCECETGASCQTAGKHPRVTGWQEHATHDQVQIRQWWQRWPLSNIGGAAGKKSGRVVLDIDLRHGGDVSLELLEHEHESLPDTVEVITGGGGRHLYFQDPGVPIGNSVSALGPGLDIRAAGGNVVLPGSIHISGRVYEYELTHGPEDVPLAPMPGWLLALLITRGNGRTTPTAESTPIREGRRNDTLFRLAGSMRAKGMSHAAIAAAMSAENMARCQPPLAEEEVRKLAESAPREVRVEQWGRTHL